MPNLKKTYRKFLYYLGTKLAHRPAQGTPRITLHPEGDTTFVRAQGGVRVDISDIITSVGITNLTEVAEQHITRIAGSRSHLLRFASGGELRFAYNRHEQLVKLKSWGLSANIAPGNVVTYAMDSQQSQVKVTS